MEVLSEVPLLEFYKLSFKNGKYKTNLVFSATRKGGTYHEERREIGKDVDWDYYIIAESVFEGKQMAFFNIPSSNLYFADFKTKFIIGTRNTDDSANIPITKKQLFNMCNWQQNFNL